MIIQPARIGTSTRPDKAGFGGKRLLYSMRKAGTKYEEIGQLPKNALPVSTFATKKGMQVGHVYMKHDRYHIKGESKTDPGYIIRCFLGSNYVIPTGVLQK